MPNWITPTIWTKILPSACCRPAAHLPLTHARSPHKTSCSPNISIWRENYNRKMLRKGLFNAVVLVHYIKQICKFGLAVLDLGGLLLLSSLTSHLRSYVLQDVDYFEHKFNVRPKPFKTASQKRSLDKSTLHVIIITVEFLHFF